MMLNDTPTDVLRYEIKIFNDFIYRLENRIDINPETDQIKIEVLIKKCKEKITEFEQAITKLKIIMNTTHPTCLLTKICQEIEGFKGTKHEGVDVCEDGCVHHRPEHKFYLWKLSTNTVAVTDYVEIKDGLVNIDQFGYVKAEFLKSAREKQFLLSYAMKLGLGL